MADWYVAKTGSDANPGTFAQPLLTLGVAVTHLAAGDTLYIRVGIYNEILWFNIPSGTSWANPVRLINYNGETVRIRPASDAVGSKVIYLAGFGGGGASGSQHYIELNGLIIDATLITSDAVKIESNATTGYTPHHIRVTNCIVIGGQNLHDGGLNGNMCLIASAQTATDVGFHEFTNNVLFGAGASDTFGYGLYCQASDCLYDHNECYDVNGAGVQVYNGYVGDLQASRNKIQYSSFHDIIRTADTRVDPIVFGRGVDNAAINNLIYNNGGGNPTTYAIYFFHGTNILAYGNTCYNNGTYGFLVEPAAINPIIRNNLLASHGTDYHDNGGISVTQDHNLSSDGTTGLAGSPSFVNAGAGDFRLASGSLAINTGATIPSSTPDYAGVSRPRGSAYCIGAYEFVPAGSPHLLRSPTLDGLGLSAVA